MRITFHGAAQEVTGSCHALEVNGRRLLIDCGLIQGRAQDEARNRDPFAFDPRSVDAVVLTHAHLDHSGRLPLLLKAGFRGPIHAHPATIDLTRILLRDSAYLMEKESEWVTRKRLRKGLRPEAPLYTARDLAAVNKRFRPLPYETDAEILPGVSLRLHDAGHILGSSIVAITAKSGGATRRVVFSGDLGHRDAPILRNPQTLTDANLVVMESTYGDRRHRAWDDTLLELGAALNDASEHAGNILIPAFAIGRTQELLYTFARHYEAWNLGRWTVFLDSPMAIEATEVYQRHFDLYDREAARLRKSSGDLFKMPRLHFTRTAQQSMAINRINSGAIVIAGSGMCTGGRIKQHLKHNVWRDSCHIIITGYQALGTTGRALVDGAPYIRLWGETVRVAAKIHTIGGLSAHADQVGLLDWIGGFKSHPRVALVHGESDAITALQRALRERGIAAEVPTRGQSVDV
jgi:metallo-beta-lactamase family protein